MLWEDEDRTRDVSNIVKSIIPPVGMRQIYRPGQEGFLQQDLSQIAGTVPEETGGTKNIPTISNVATASPLNQINIGGRDYSMPTAAINEAVLGATGGGGPSGVPKYGIPPEMLSRFDEVVKAITGPSPESELLRNQAQGFGLGLPSRRIPGTHGFEPSAQMAASQALAHIEGLKRSAASHLANSLSNMMMEPNRFATEIFKTSSQADIERERNRLTGRKIAVEEAELPLKARKLAMTAPETVAGYGPGGERQLYGWNPQTQGWGMITKGAVPVEVHREGTLIDPTTGKILAQGEQGGRFKEDLGKLAFKEYVDELKAIANDLTLQGEDKKSIEKKTKRQQEAWGRLQDNMERLGHGELFGSTTAIPKRNPNETIEEYLKRTRMQ